MKIIDNFLPMNDFILISSAVMSSHFSWFYSPCVNHEDDPMDNVKNRYFEHHFFAYDHNTESYTRSIKFGLIEPFLNKLEINDLHRAKANLFPSTETLLHHSFHTDMNVKHNGAILYLNDCDGYTLFPDGTKVESVANRCLLFDSSKPHASTTCTNVKARFNINVNYS